MATKTFDELIAGATQIKQNELPETNTHNLVGEQLIAMAGKQKEVDLQSDVINVTTKFPLAAGAYYTQATARAAVTADYRKLGKKLLYQTDATTWIEEKFIGSATTDVIWNADANWQGVANKNDIVQIGADLNQKTGKYEYTQSDLKYNVGRAISLADGSYAVNVNFACSDFTYLVGIDFIEVTKSGTNTEALVAFYDEEFNYISGVSKSMLPQRIVPPSTAKFFRFSAIYNKNFEAYIYGDAPNEKTIYNNDVLGNSGKYIDTNGTLGTHLDFLYSNMIDISDAEYSFSLFSSGVITGCAIAFYTSPTFDANSFISGRIVTASEVFPINVDGPVNANFVAFSGRSGQMLIVEQLRKSTKKVHYGESLSILGDSISTFSGYIGGNLSYYPKSYLDNVDRTWWKQLLDATGMVLNKNNSWSGALMSGDDYTAGRFRCEELDNGTEPNHIIVYMGANDFKEPMGLGSCGLDSQTFNTNNFSDAYYSALSKIKTKYPNAKLYLCTIMQFNYAEDGVSGFPIVNSNGVNLIEFNEAIKKLAEIFGCEVIDFASCGNTYFNRANAFGDGRLHPNTTGAYNLFLTVIKYFEH